MPPRPGVPNRGPAQAEANRAALVRAARELFAERGAHVPYNAIARRAGVGQGVLYRHFPDRLDLARAIFDENLEAMERVADPAGAGTLDPEAFLRVWTMLLDQTVACAAIVEMAIRAREEWAGYDGHERLVALLDRVLEPARTAGVVDPRATAEDVLLVHRMAFGVVTTAVGGDAAEVRPTLDRALDAVVRLRPWRPEPEEPHAPGTHAHSSTR